MRRLALAILFTVTSFSAQAASVITADRYLDVVTGKYVDHPAIFVGDDGRITGVSDERSTPQ